jgi:dCTP diphosphatase
MSSQPSTAPTLAALQDQLRQFVAERDWGQFHTPKNLSAALSVEAAELLEHFQWLHSGSRDELGAARVQQVSMEMADVLSYLLLLAAQLDIDLLASLHEKIALNRAKYPAELVRGDARKYDQYK